MATLGYYYGTGFENKDNPGTNDGTQVGTVSQSSTPTPPISANWLSDNRNISGPVTYIQINSLAATAGSGAIEFYLNIPSTASYIGGATLFSKFNAFYDREFFYVDETGLVGWIYYNGAAIFNNTYTVSLDANHLIRCEWDGVSTRLYVDGALRATGATAPIQSYATFSIGYDGLGFYGNSYSIPYVNGFALSNNITDTYPPVPVIPIITNVLANAQMAMLINIQGQDESTGIQIYPDLPTVLSNTIQAIAVDSNGNSL